MEGIINTQTINSNHYPSQEMSELIYHVFDFFINILSHMICLMRLRD